jgi:hypothetical protein
VCEIPTVAITQFPRFIVTPGEYRPASLLRRGRCLHACEDCDDSGDREHRAFHGSTPFAALSGNHHAAPVHPDAIDWQRPQGLPRSQVAENPCETGTLRDGRTRVA